MQVLGATWGVDGPTVLQSSGDESSQNGKWSPKQKGRVGGE